MRRLGWRWAVVAALVASLVALPSLVAAVPVAGSRIDAPELLKRIRASQAVGWSGYGESRGTLVLPDVRELGELPGLVGGTTRSRAWWRGPDDWRVDALTLVGEVDQTRDPDGAWTWNSADRRALRLVGDVDIRFPAAADLLAPVLGHRLAGTQDVVLSRLPSRRVAGRAAAGLRLVPREPATTTVRQVDLWADPRTGLPLRVEVRAAGVERPVLQSVLLDLDLTRPPAGRTDFQRPVRASVTVGESPDVAALADRYAPYALPNRLVGLPRRDRSALSTGGGVATYGDGFTAVVLVPLPPDLGRRLLSRIDDRGDGRTARVTTPLVNGLVAVAPDDRAYFLAGTVPETLLRGALAQLRADPPPLRSGP